MAEKRYFTVKEVAERFGVHRTAVTLWLKAGLLRVAERFPHMVLIAAEDLTDFRPPYVVRKQAKPGPVARG